LRAGDTLIVWKLDRLGRDLRHLVNTVHDLTVQGIGFKVLTGHRAAVDTTTPAGTLIVGISYASNEELLGFFFTLFCLFVRETFHGRRGLLDH
jgi:DNA invertase Pin-like site-specific DNA recombinase